MKIRSILAFTILIYWFSSALVFSDAPQSRQILPVLSTRESLTNNSVRILTVTAESYFKLVFSSRCRVLAYPGESGKIGARIIATYDLANDPEQKVNLSSSQQDICGVGIVEGSLQLIESTTARVVIDIRGFLGQRSKGTETEIVRRYVIYPTGQIYLRDTHSATPCDTEGVLGFCLSGSAAFTPADAHNDPGPVENFWLDFGGQKYLSGTNKSAFFLFHSNVVHPSTFMNTSLKICSVVDTKMNFLHVLHFQKGRAHYWGRWVWVGKDNVGYGDVNFAWMPPPAWDQPYSQTYTFLLQIKPDTMIDNKVVLPYVEDYRNPAKLEFSHGQSITNHPNDLNHDGYDESEGCYVMQADKNGVDFTINGSARSRFNPIFKIVNWLGEPPSFIAVNGRQVPTKDHFHAARSGNDLVIQYFGTIDQKTDFGITPN